MSRCRFAECRGDGLPRPAHPFRREFGVVAELLGDRLGAALGAEPAQGRGGGPPDLPCAGLPDHCNVDTNSAFARAALMLRWFLVVGIAGPPQRLDSSGYIT